MTEGQLFLAVSLLTDTLLEAFLLPLLFPRQFDFIRFSLFSSPLPSHSTVEIALIGNCLSPFFSFPGCSCFTMTHRLGQRRPRPPGIRAFFSSARYH